MTTTTTTRHGPTLDRRTVLRGMGATAGALALGGGSTLFTGRAAAAPGNVTETIYLSDSGQPGDTFGTRLFSVDLDDTASTATLTLLTTAPDAEFPKVDAIAATPDGTLVYLFDKTTARLGEYDTSAGTFSDLGVVSFEDAGGASIATPDDVVLATYTLGGEFVLGSQGDDTIYTLDVGTLTATERVVVTGMDLNGADFAFDANGDLFVYTNDGGGQLFTVDLATGAATSVGPSGRTLTGLSVRDGGLGDLVGSSKSDDALIVLDKSSGSPGTVFDLQDAQGNDYVLGSGDLAIGRLVDATCIDCVGEGVVAEFEFQSDQETFVLVGGDDTDVSLASYATNQSGDPVGATFDTNFCALGAVVESGEDCTVSPLDSVEGQVSVGSTEGTGIDTVVFFCGTGAAEDYVEQNCGEPELPPSPYVVRRSRLPPEHGFLGVRRRRGRRGRGRRGRRIPVRSRNRRRDRRRR
jgi:hypothetical protein